ncbi:hypothetical protein B0H14DRAFT_3782432 [Mycena olivaceomarginata]|nr:hypothetical protein B0H14DRAFT_3782432 [Mycena olivaceomarginata]
MPEKGVLCLFEREIGWEEHRLGPRVNQNDDEVFSVCGLDRLSVLGHFVTHPECCARITGARQTFTVHVSSPLDDRFISLPRLPPAPVVTKQTPISHYCSSCKRGYSDDDPASSTPYVSIYSAVPSTPAAEFVNSLNINGCLTAKARGKELIIAICNATTGANILFRVGYYMEGHCFWMPTKVYKDIISQTPVLRGEKSFSYPIPAKYIDGPKLETNRVISIQAAFIRPDYTLVFADHNVMIQFHLMRVTDSFVPADLNPHSNIWPALWSSTHGPVYSLEPVETVQAINDWRQKICDNKKYSHSIFKSMKTHQTAFNGSGAQEATDQLFLAYIHPLMPARLVCLNNTLFQRLLNVVIAYDHSRNNLALRGALPYVSGDSPFHMNTSGHDKYLRQVFCFKRQVVKLDADQLRLTGVQSDVTPAPLSAPLKLREGSRTQKTTSVPNIYLVISSESDLKAYTPFTARVPDDWPKASRETVGTDVRDEVNSTTLGLYSFRIFVDCAWMTQKVAVSGGLPVGRREVNTIGQSNRKRPLASDIAKHDRAKKPRQALEEKENIDVSEGIMTRSQRRRATM